MTEWWGILRCRTWNVWPAKTSNLPPLDIDYGAESPIRVNRFVDSYGGTQPNLEELAEKSEFGPVLWAGYRPGAHRIWNSIYWAVGEFGRLVPQPPRQAHRGELDIRLSFNLDAKPPKLLVEDLRARAFEVLGLLNLGLSDFATPSMPFQIVEVLTDKTASLRPLRIETKPRQSLDEAKLNDFLSSAEDYFSSSVYEHRHHVALELYAAQFTEEQIRIRFLMLVMAIEALSRQGTKHKLARDLLKKWKAELKAVMAECADLSEEREGLQALLDQFGFASKEGVLASMRRLFDTLPVGPEEKAQLKVDVEDVYKKRCTLVHDGYLPANELPALEGKARELLEKLFAHDFLLQKEDQSDGIVSPG